MTTEPVTATSFSFLRGASQPAHMVEAAIVAGLSGLGIADRNSVAGVVRAWIALGELREAGLAEGFRLLTGARLVFADGTPDIVAYPQTRHGWGRLTRLLTLGNMRAVKGDCILHFADLVPYLDDLQLIVMPTASGADTEAHKSPPDYRFTDGDTPHLTIVSALPADLTETVTRLAALAPNRVWLAAPAMRKGRDARLLARHARIAKIAGVPLIATSDALYATPEQRPLHDILTCIRHGTTVADAGRVLEANAERHIRTPAEFAHLYRAQPDALTETQRFADGIGFDLSQLKYQYPNEPVPQGWDANDWLAKLVWEAAHGRHGPVLPERLVAMVQKELDFIKGEDFPHYFLTVHDLVHFARSQDPPILCQGRGSAANSAVCFLLGITSVDPLQYDLLFSRFVSADRKEPPDIDVDFEHERREEVMQYIYRRYGRHRAGIVATVIHYRPRSAVREVGKALGLTEDVTQRLSSTVWGSYASTYDEERMRDSGFDPGNPEIARLNHFVQQTLHLPRHLSQHVGGFVLTEARLDETVPVLNGAMADRSFIEWDKDDIDALGLMKVDVLALGMLTCIAKAFAMLGKLSSSPSTCDGEGERAVGNARRALLPARPKGGGGASDGANAPPSAVCATATSPSQVDREDKHYLTLRSIDLECGDPAVYDMLCKGDSIGVFQVESRAQINMLPRMKPRTLYDLTIQVAIVRPGPIQGDMVHPYLRRRAGREKAEFPSPHPDHGPPDELYQVLGKTLGVPLFQEQAMKLAMVAARFTDSEANQLRKAMATFRHTGGIDKFETKMIGGMVARGYDPEFAERCYRQIQGFGSYGFPESHALSFARLVYISSWIKCHHPAVFAAALLNSQPMGFYAPAQIVRDAREHGVKVRAPEVNGSEWDSSVSSSPLTCDGEGERAVGKARGALLPARPNDGGGALHRDPPLHQNASRFGPPPHRKSMGRMRLHLGLRQIDSFRREWADRILAARPFTSVEDLARRAQLPPRAMKLLADADALRSLGQDRREGGWDVRRLPGDELPLFAAARARELAEEPDMALPEMQLGEHVSADYQTIRLSLKAHPMQILRPTFATEGIASCADLAAAKAGARLRTAGVVLVRQRPGNGKAIFITIEDETGVANLIMWARTFEAYRRAVMASRLIEVHGEVQRSPEGVIHLMTHRLFDRSALLATLSEAHKPNIVLSRADTFLNPLHPSQASRSGAKTPAPNPRHSHPRDVRTFPKSRDFH